VAVAVAVPVAASLVAFELEVEADARFSARGVVVQVAAVFSGSGAEVDAGL
jgi:hypothetical protein